RAGIALKTLARHGGINLSANIRANHAALRAVGIASKNARLDACGQVRRIVRGHARKRALPRILRCAISSGLHSLKDLRLAGLVRLDHIAKGSISIGSTVGRLRRGYRPHERWRGTSPSGLVQIAKDPENADRGRL